MKLFNILFILIAIPLFVSSEDVLNEGVYWELTRVDAKIEEKKFDEAEKILSRLQKKLEIKII